MIDSTPAEAHDEHIQVQMMGRFKEAVLANGTREPSLLLWCVFYDRDENVLKAASSTLPRCARISDAMWRTLDSSVKMAIPQGQVVKSMIQHRIAIKTQEGMVAQAGEWYIQPRTLCFFEINSVPDRFLSNICRRDTKLHGLGHSSSSSATNSREAASAEITARLARANPSAASWFF